MYQNSKTLSAGYLLLTLLIAGIGLFGYWWNYGLRRSLMAFIVTLVFGWWLFLGEYLLGTNVTLLHLVIRDVGVIALGVVMDLWSSAFAEVSLFDVNEWLTRITKIILSIAALLFVFSGITGLASSILIAPGPIEFAIWFRGVMILLFDIAALFVVIGCIINIVILVTTKFGLEGIPEEIPPTPSS
jgi:hypothetical protein